MARNYPPSTSAIPVCWDPIYGRHEYGGLCYTNEYGDGHPGCYDWWLARSQADPRAARDCDDQHKHGGPHLWTGHDGTPPLPYTMWVCPGRDRCAPGEVSGW